MTAEASSRLQISNSRSPAFHIDAITNVVVGAGWFSSANDPADVLLGLDLRIGRLRVRPTWRFREGVFDSRVTTTF